MWLFVNRANQSYNGTQITLNLSSTVVGHLTSHPLGAVLYDCWRGVAIPPHPEGETDPPSHYYTVTNGVVSVAFPIYPRGYGCVLLAGSTPPPGSPLGDMLAKMRNHTSKGPIGSFDKNFRFLQ